MLPARSAHRFSLSDVLPDLLGAISGEPGRLGLPAVDSAIVVVVDGLGAANLRERAGHARTLTAASWRSIGSTFPTTTAVALATLTTGAAPGRHGLVGYSVLDREGDRVVNQLTGWDARVDPATWQRERTVFERAVDAGVHPVAVGAPRFADSGFTAAVLRGADYRPGASFDDRVAQALHAVREGRSLVYLYMHELDKAGHAHGWRSDDWTRVLEQVDAAVAALVAGLPPRVGVVVTADHGMVDVGPDDQVVVPPELLEGVRLVAGEPRGLQLGLERGADPAVVVASWSAHLGRLAAVATREEVVAAGWLGEVDAEVLPRLGDVLVLARGRTALYVSDDDPGRGMIGQHGSVTPEETAVPLVRLGAFA